MEKGFEIYSWGSFKIGHPFHFLSCSTEFVRMKEQWYHLVMRDSRSQIILVYGEAEDEHLKFFLKDQSKSEVFLEF